MNRLFNLSFLLLSLNCFAENNSNYDSLFNRANHLLLTGYYKDALDNYANLEFKGVKEPELFSNMGNAFFKNGQIGWAVYYYEKALLLKPSDDQIKHNLSQIQPKGNKIEIQEKWQYLTKKYIANRINVIAHLGIIFLILGSFSYFILSFVTLKKKVEIIKSLGIIFFFIGLLLMLIVHHIYTISERDAIIIERNVFSRAGPSMKAVKLFALTEGEKVLIIENFDGWIKVKNEQGQAGWILSIQMAVIKVDGNKLED